MKAEFVLTVSRDDDEDATGINMESSGYTEAEVLEALVRTAESIIQRQMRESAMESPLYGGLAEDRREYIISMQARLALIDMLLDLDYLTTSIATIEL